MNSSKITSFLQYQLPAVAWAVFIYTVSSIPQSRLPNFIDYSDKLVHAGVFMILCWFLDVAFRFQGISFLSKNSLWIAVLLTSFFGATDEYHQLFTPGRSTDILDWGADTIGAATYAFIYMKFKFYEWHNKEQYDK